MEGGAQNLRFGSASAAGTTGDLINLIPKSRLDGIRAFSRWKCDERHPLDEFAQGISVSYGDNIAKAIISTLVRIPGKEIGSMSVSLDDGEDIHLPPKISYLLVKAADRAKTLGRRSEMMDSVAEDFKNIFESDLLVHVTADIILGDIRTHSFSCCENDAGWISFMESYESDGPLLELALCDVPFAEADFDAYNDIALSIFEAIHAKGSEDRMGEKSRFRSILETALGIQKDDIAPGEERTLFVDRLRQLGRVMYAQRADSLKKECIVPLDTRCTGRLKELPRLFPDEIA